MLGNIDFVMKYKKLLRKVLFLIFVSNCEYMVLYVIEGTVALTQRVDNIEQCTDV